MPCMALFIAASGFDRTPVAAAGGHHPKKPITNIRNPATNTSFFAPLLPDIIYNLSELLDSLDSLIDFPEFADRLGHPANCVGDLLLCVETAEPESEGAMRHLVAYSERFQNVACLDAGRCAGRP